MFMKQLISFLITHDMMYESISSAFEKIFKTIPEVAILCDTSEAVVRSWIDTNVLKSIEIKGTKMIFIQDLEDFMENRNAY